MNTKQLSRIGAFILILILAITSCKPSTTFKITGTLEGLPEGKVILMSLSERTLTDTAVVENGSFTFTGSLVEPSQFYLMVEDRRAATLSFYNENSNITIKGHVDSLMKAVIEGSKIQDDANLYSERVKALGEKYKVNELRTELYSRGSQGAVTEERRKEIEAILDTHTKENDQLAVDFIKEFPKSNFSVILVGRATSGKSSAVVEEFINMLDPKLAQLPSVLKMRETVTEMKKTEVSMESFITEASNLTYSVDNTFAGKDHKNVIYLAVMSNDNVVAITSEGNVLLISPTGAKIAEFKSKLNSKPSVIAVDNADNIYVLGTIIEKKTVESRGRSIQVETPTGVESIILNSKGVKVKDLKLEGVITATGVRVTENNILVADTRGRLINIYDLETGAKKSSIEKLRTCCGILDFSVRNNSEVLVANLGAFRVNGYDFTGAATIAFGQRGTGVDEFHGCCNPVSVAFLSNGGIVTVEKDPTRIKVYSKEGAKKIEGIDELVKGCAYIPMIVDTKDNVYLASKTDGIVKCISVK